MKIKFQGLFKYSLISIVFLIVLYFRYNINRIWTPITLSNKFSSFSDRLIDPEDYLDYDSKNSILDKIKKIRKETNFNIRVYIISEISDEYTEMVNNKKKKNISLFLDELAKLVINNEEDEDNSIFLIFSVIESKIRIRTGINAKNKMSDRKCSNLIKSVKNIFRQKNYEKTILTLLEKINYRLISSFMINLRDDVYDFIISTLSLIIILFLIISILTILVKMLAKEDNCDDLGNVQEIVLKESLCFICKKEIKKNKFDEAENKAKILKVTMYCDHSFHFNCIVTWMEENNKCPKCISDETSQKKRKKSIINNLQIDSYLKYFRTVSLSD